MKNKGFTLIELLVVVLIIGILAAVAMPQYTKAVEKSRIAEAKEILNTMRKNYQLCMLEFNDAAEACNAAYGDMIPDYLTIDLPGTWKDKDECFWQTSPCLITKNWSYETDAADGSSFDAIRLKNGSVEDAPYLLSMAYNTGVVTCFNVSGSTTVCNQLCGANVCEIK